MSELVNFLGGVVSVLTEVPVLVFGDRNAAVVEQAKKIGLGEEFIQGDPMNADIDAIVSPANTVGEMSGGYDLVIRNRLGVAVETAVMKSLEKNKIYLGQARTFDTGHPKIKKLIVVPTVVGSLVGGNNEVGTIQSLTPSVDVIEIGAYNLLMEAYRNGIKRVGSVLLGGGVGGVRKEVALKAMLAGYGKAYDEIYELICEKN